MSPLSSAHSRLAACALLATPGADYSYRPARLAAACRPPAAEKHDAAGRRIPACAGWRCLLAHIGADIERGLTLSRAFAAWPQVFPPVWCAMFALGELTGRLDSCCAERAQSEARLWRIRQQVMRSLRYPLLVSFGAVGVMMLIVLVLLPAFARIYL
ncbi:hypothetical protein D8L93_08195 [Sodalis-like symbiont of Bactericera trigonica]|nr:hypothetical protein D8L93_08195 [Sodalis-like symbiont of Bactericera trigonica]